MSGIPITAQNADEVARNVKHGSLTGPSSVRRSPSIAALIKALIQAQAEMQNPAKEAFNPHFKVRYADLAAVRDAVLPVLNAHGLALIQLPCDVDDAPALTTLLAHESGEWIETTMRLRPGKMDPQGVGSALTYMRRYSLQAVAGVAAEDDDGNAASRPGNQQGQRAPQVNAQNSGKARQHFEEAVKKCASREEATPLWRRYEADRDAGIFTQADADAVEAAFKAAMTRFPRQTAVTPAAGK